MRWLRPEFQNPSAQAAPQQVEIETGDSESETATPISATKPQPWPKEPVDRVRAVADLLATSPHALSVDDIAARFSSRGAWKKRLPPLLDMLVALERAQERGGRYRVG